MNALIKEKVDYALCDSLLEPKISFNNLGLMQRWIEAQTLRHGVAPSLTPCRIVTRTEVETIE